MKGKKKPLITFRAGSKQPILLYFLTAAGLSCAIIAASLIVVGFTPSFYKELQRGDTSGNNIVNSYDALRIMLYLNDSVSFNGSELDAGDINRDGIVDKNDALMILDYSSDSVEKLGQLSHSAAEMDSLSTGIKNSNTESEPEAENNSDDEGFSSAGSSKIAAFSTSEKNVYTSARIANSWQADGKFMYQIDVTVRNNSGTTIYMSSADVYFNRSVTVEKYWSCYPEQSQSPKEAVFDCYNSVSPSGVSTYGFIVSSDKEISITSVE